MTVRAAVRPSSYLDSVALLGVAQELKALPGVREAALLMGTPANHELIAAAGLATPSSRQAGPADLILAVDAESDDLAASALALADRLLAARRAPAKPGGLARPRTLAAARRRLPAATLASISVPGPYAAAEARQALRAGLHVFLFSDHVTLEEEVRLKTLAARRDLLCMGPDCGTAFVNGVGLGFANVVPRGRVGIVAASGTGLQAVACRLAARGEGISHGLGVGGRDLSAAVGGLMMVAALEALARDAGTALVVLVSKPADPAVLPRLERALAALGKPAVVCCLGAASPPSSPGRWVETLADAADAAVAILRREPWTARPFGDPAAIRSRLARLAGATPAPAPPAGVAPGAGVGVPGPGGILGLYTGGTLAAEARLILERLVGPVGASLDSPRRSGLHRVVDLGADEYTIGRPHPMLDPEARAARVREAGRSGAAEVLLVDLVLGRGAHPDPAAPLAAAIREARAAAAGAGRVLSVVGSVVGTTADPQGLAGQVAALESAGAAVLPSNAEAARFAALVARADLVPALLPA